MSRAAAKAFFSEILAPGLRALEPAIEIPYSADAARFLLAVALQETECLHRYQVVPGANPGPARGWWLFERGGGVIGVMHYHRSTLLARALCEHCRVEWNEHAVHRALEGHDLLAVGFARLLLFTSPDPIPKTEQRGWTEYARKLWKPAKPLLEKWPDNWRLASEIVEEG